MSRVTNLEIFYEFKKEDFILLEDGKPQTLAIFELKSSKGSRCAYAKRRLPTVVETVRPTAIAAGSTAATGKPIDQVSR